MSFPFFFQVFDGHSVPHLTEESLHHAFHVLRMQAGDKLFLTNGNGLRLFCQIQLINKKECSLEVINKEMVQASAPSLHLAVAFTKNTSRIEWLLEKACEVGVHQITPLICKRSERIHFKKERFEKILVSAMLQSQQCYLPALHEPCGLAELIQADDEEKLIAHCAGTSEKYDLLTSLSPQKNTLICIGPEGDFTEEEIALCLQKKYRPVSLGQTRLRTETAALYVCVLFNALKNK